MVAPVFEIETKIHAPLATVWQAWTEEPHLREWLGPAGCPITTSSMRFEVSGRFHYGMALPDGSTMWGRWIFKEISPETRLVWDHQFTDATGEALTRHPFCDTWPLEMVTSLTLESLSPNETHLVMALTCINANAPETATFTDNLDNMRHGWGATLEQLKQYLGNLLLV